MGRSSDVELREYGRTVIGIGNRREGMMYADTSKEEKGEKPGMIRHQDSRLCLSQNKEKKDSRLCER